MDPAEKRISAWIALFLFTFSQFPDLPEMYYLPKELTVIKKILLVLFILFSIVSILPQRTHPGKPSAELEKVESEQRIDYYDNGVLCYATDRKYASLVRETVPSGVLETYLDEKGKPAKQNAGHYGLLKEYDEEGRNWRVTYLSQSGDPLFNTSGYATLERSYNDQGKVAYEHYYGENGEPVRILNGSYGQYREYDDQGRNYRTTYLGPDDKPSLNTSGYAVIVRKYNDEGKTAYEHYFDEEGNPAPLSSGAYGIHWEGSVTTYLGRDGRPAMTKMGYAIVERDGPVESYYDADGNHVALTNGQYAVRREGGRTIYLDRQGREIFVLSHYLHEHPAIVIAVGIFLILLCRKWKQGRWIVGAAYVIFILYMTLMYRQEGDSRMNLSLFWSYRQYLSSRTLRLEVLYNIWLFVPLGVILSGYRYAWLFGIALSVFIEIVQYKTGLGLCELDDVISNSLGMLIGLLAAGQGWRRKRRRKGPDEPDGRKD